MTVDFRQLFLLGVFTTALHWLIARSEIARPIWSRAHGWVNKLLSCPACSGYWLGGALAWWIHPFGLLDSAKAAIMKTILTGLAAMVITPIFEGVMVWGLRESTIAVDERESDSTDVGLTESGDKTPLERPVSK